MHISESLIAAIKSDIATAEEKLEQPQNKVYKDDNFFTDSDNKTLLWAISFKCLLNVR